MENKKFKLPEIQLSQHAWLCLTIILAAGIFAGAIAKLRLGTKTVSVRGLSEREVIADLALWPVKASATANTLPEMYKQIDDSQKRMKEFFLKQGFTEEEINIRQPKIDDRQAQLYNEYQNPGSQRYIAEFGMLIKSKKIDNVKKTVKGIGELVGQGVSLSSNDVEYIYTKLNEIKPQMIEEATTEARKAADKFAWNSRSFITGIKHAEQGLFTIETVHYYTQEVKNVRVVTTVEYVLL